MDDLRYKEFRRKLRELLKEYDASIDFTCSPCSDTHGVNGEAIQISLGNKVAETFDYDWGIDFRSFDWR